jgi:zinc/manganese transport system permease protein
MLQAFQEFWLYFPLLQNTLLAGSIIAIVAALMGYFLIMRGLTFAGHALPYVGFAGAAGAVLLGIDPVFGLFAFTLAGGVGIGFLGKEAHARDITIGILMTFALGLGLMFFALYSGYAELVYSYLFGTILGISQQDVLVTAVCSLIAVAALIVMFRPLLFSTMDPIVASSRGIPVYALSIIFMALVAIAVAMSIQIVGTLLVFTLLVGPAATAIRIANRPLWAIILAVFLGLLYTWLGIFLAVVLFNGTLPVSFFIATISFSVYLPIRLLSPLWIGRGIRRQRNQEQQVEIEFEHLKARECVAVEVKQESFK